MGWIADLMVEMGPADSYTPRPSRNGVVGRTMRPELPPDYRPADDEEFMNPLQTEYFRQKLVRWRAELLADSSGTLRHLKEESLLKPDLTDRASLETERAIELRTRDRERKLISKIDAALSRIDSGTYGFCEETDQPIGIRRLEARPIATLSIEAQERHERMERTYRDE
jgi:DnaK suppressor protein